MAYLNANSFVYDGISSDEFDLGIGWIKDDNPNQLATGLEKELQHGEPNMVRTDPNQYGAIYAEMLQFEFVIFHKSRQKFTWDESHAINQWLAYSNTYKKLHFNDENSEYINFYAVCTNIVDMVYSGINAKKITFVCSSPFGYMQEIKKKMTIMGSAPQDFKIQNLSDNGIYYPTVEISVNGNYTGDIRIENVLDGGILNINFSQIVAEDNKKIIKLNGRQTIITDRYGLLIPAYKIGWDLESDIYWFRLLEDTNLIRITGPSEVTMYFEFPKKVGAV